MKSILSAIFLCALALTPAYGEGNGGVFSEVRAEYVRLRNIDPTTDDLGVRPLWKELEKKMAQSSLVASNSNSFSALRHMIDRADLLTRLYRVEGDESRLRSAKSEVTSALRLLGRENESSSEIHTSLKYEALILKSDIYLMEQSYQEAERVVNLIQPNKSEGRALSRLNGIRNGTFEGFLPAPELERPNVVSLSWGEKGRRRGGAKKLIVIDPGHGGDDAGAVGKLGLLEKELTLDISKRVAQLASEIGMRVVLTRDDDTFVPLARRTRIANHLNAAAFISIHNNASPKHTLDGFESFYLDNTDDQAGKKLADRENSAGASGAADDIDFMLSDLIQTGKMEDSIRLTHMINNALSQSFGDRSEGVTVRGVKKAPFFVLVGAHMPCTLLELLFVDHHMDAKRLAQPKFRERAARAIVRGIASFFGDGIVKSPLPREKIQNEKSGGKKVGDPQKKVGTVKGSNEGKKRRTRGR